MRRAEAAIRHLCDPGTEVSAHYVISAQGEISQLVPEARRAFVDEGADPGRCVVIPNGYDDEDFAGAAPARTTRDEPLRMVHIGTFHPADLSAGMTANTLRRVRNRQIEPLGRTGYYLLHGIARWRDRVGDDAARRSFSLHLYGRADAPCGT